MDLLHLDLVVQEAPMIGLCHYMDVFVFICNRYLVERPDYMSTGYIIEQRIQFILHIHVKTREKRWL